MALDNIADADHAKITIMVPPTDANNAFLAVPSFSGAPCAAKNKIPVITQKIITNMPPTIYITLETLATMPVIVCAAAMAGKIRMPNKVKTNKLFFTPLEVCLYMLLISISDSPIVVL